MSTSYEQFKQDVKKWGSIVVLSCAIVVVGGMSFIGMTSGTNDDAEPKDEAKENVEKRKSTPETEALAIEATDFAYHQMDSITDAQSRKDKWEPGALCEQVQLAFLKKFPGHGFPQAHIE